MTIWHIYTLIDPTTAEIKPYQPGDQVHEITNAINAARLALLRERLAGLEPVTTPRRETAMSWQRRFLLCGKIIEIRLIQIGVSTWCRISATIYLSNGQEK